VGNKALAGKIAELLDAERPALDLSTIQASLDAINARLDKLESTTPTAQPAFHSTRSEHPSLDKLSIAEAIADQIFAGAGKEKACSFEPNGKPCDHCSMCNSRGF
jgi:hypothetical protein